MSLNSLISLKMIFMLYGIDFWQGLFPEAVEMHGCLTRARGCAGREGEAEQGCLWRRDTPLVPRFALPQELWKLTQRNRFTNALKAAFPPKGVVILQHSPPAPDPLLHPSGASPGISMSV